MGTGNIRSHSWGVRQRPGGRRGQPAQAASSRRYLLSLTVVDLCDWPYFFVTYRPVFAERYLAGLLLRLDPRLAIGLTSSLGRRTT